MATSAELIGVNTTEIAKLEQFFGIQFPANYQLFLQHFGRSAGMLSPWMAIYFDDLKEMREQFDFLVASQGETITLPDTALIIGNWESVFDFIICNQDDDPAVFRIDLCADDAGQFRRYSESYSEHLENMINTSDATSLPSDFFEDDHLLPADDIIQY